MVDAVTTPPPETAADAAGAPEHPPVPGQYQVRLDVFQGPFDLLLQLIAKRRVDVTQVDLADITQDFLASLDAIDLLDLETATRFLVVAATLIELKAARLLPTDQRDELEDLLGEARDVLYARLLEYRAFRDVAHDLARRLELHEAHHGRDVPLDARWRRLVPETAIDVDVEDLARIAARALRPAPEPTISIDHIRRSFISIRDAATEVLTRLASSSTDHFRSLVSGHSRGDAVVYFLALLELYKLGALRLEQPDHHGELRFEPSEDRVDVAVIADLADDYEDGTGEDDVSGDDTSADEPTDGPTAAEADDAGPTDVVGGGADAAPSDTVVDDEEDAR